MIRSSTVGESQLYSIGSSVSSSSTISIRLPSYTSTIYLFFIVTSTTHYDANQGGNNVGLLYFSPFFHTTNYRCTNLVSFNVLWYGEIANYLRMANTTSLCITLFNDSVSFHTSWVRHKTSAFLRFSGCIKMEHWPEMG